MKFETGNYLGEATPYAKFGFCMFTGACQNHNDLRDVGRPRECPRIGEVVTPGVYSLYIFIFFYFLAYLLTCKDRIVRRRNVVNGL